MRTHREGAEIRLTRRKPPPLGFSQSDFSNLYELSGSNIHPPETQAEQNTQETNRRRNAIEIVDLCLYKRCSEERRCDEPKVDHLHSMASVQGEPVPGIRLCGIHSHNVDRPRDTTQTLQDGSRCSRWASTEARSSSCRVRRGRKRSHGDQRCCTP